ncbi:MAG: phosphotransferase, partial [Pseudomonadota bacterium]
PSFEQAEGSYPRRARLAHGNNTAFLSIGELLRKCGLSAPTVLAAEPQAGFILLEDLGDAKIAENGVAIAERYLLAADVLAAFHEQALPPDLPLGYRPPRFDATLGVFEVGLYPQWVLGQPTAETYRVLWREVLEGLWRGDDHVALRDFHSPNCLWLPAREGIAKIGVIDYQDAMIAPTAFDVVSLAQDARVPVPDGLAEEIVVRYLAGRSALDEVRWREAYAIIGAQRAVRIAGVFRRLNDRDGKPQYLEHLPHVTRALAKNLAATPALGKLRAWFAEHAGVAA